MTMPIIAVALLLLPTLLFGGGSALAATCLSAACHQDIAAIKQQHAPVQEGDCAACHNQLNQQHPTQGGKGFAPTARGKALCAGCHEPLGKKTHVHEPVKSGECESCHKPHGTSERFLLEVGEDQSGLCLGCHDAEPFKKKYMHGPAAVGSCSKCHDPHESSERLLLKGPVQAVCLACHADFAQAMRSASVVHQPVLDKACTACHNPHGSSAPMFLYQKMPELCVRCHKELDQHLAGVKVPHKPLSQQGGCTNCHFAHFGQAKGLLAADQMTVCFGCHAKDDLGTPPLKNIKKQIEGKKFLHGPVREGNCKACHDPHGSNHFRMLRGAYPSELYAPYKSGAYDGCLACHEKNMLRFADTTIYTGFRNGNKNLHYVHVAGRKGRTCRICHEPHASNGEKLINKEGTQFGVWKIPLNFVMTATGGSCAPGCHRKFKYDRVKAEDLTFEEKQK